MQTVQGIYGTISSIYNSYHKVVLSAYIPIKGDLEAEKYIVCLC